ncbi:MAG: superoxide dismutase [Flavobacteriaceae bacterium]|jgi:Fe-Mn family superoxide dismutase|nr:superoxide dismutase [Flavobacteriaceae bacterium]
MKKITVLISSVVLAFGVYSCDQPQSNNTDSANNDTIASERNLGNPADVKTDSGPFQLPELKYGYADLDKSIDAETMEVHYSKHFLGYANNLNKAVAGTELEGKTIEEIMKGMDMNNTALRNNGGGYYNHDLYFATMSPDGGGQPSGELSEAINTAFGSFDELKNQLAEAGGKRFGSGWAWLVVDNNGNLAVGSTANQDNPLMPGLEISGTPILGIDVWEHAYYLRYQNKRPDYIDAFFNVIDWNLVAEKYAQAKAE